MTQDVLLHRDSACDFGDPIGALRHCHRMIDRQLAQLEEGCRMLREGAPAPLALERLQVMKVNFSGPRDRHTQDEEQSLFPRLRAHEVELGARVLDVLDALESEHRIAEAIHSDFRELLELLSAGTEPPELIAARISRCAGALASHYRSHMHFEDEVIFPAASRVLEPGDLVEMGDEMRARRSGAKA